MRNATAWCSAISAALLVTFGAGPLLAQTVRSVDASVSTDKCYPSHGSITVPAGSTASGFTIVHLVAGNSCASGAPIEESGFSIQDARGNHLYDYRWAPGMQQPAERPAKLAAFKLGPGSYTLWVNGGRGANVLLRYTLLGRVAGTTTVPVKAKAPSGGSAGTPSHVTNLGGAGTPPVAKTALGNVWQITETPPNGGGYPGVWTRRGSSNTFDAYWDSLPDRRVTDTLQLESVSGNQVVFYRQGNQGRYTGTLSADHKRVITGTLSWAPGYIWTATIGASAGTSKPPSHTATSGRLVSGQYRVTTGPFAAIFTLYVNGSTITGSAKWVQGFYTRTDPVRGTIYGNRVTFERDCLLPDRATCHQTWVGTIRGNVIEGTWSGTAASQSDTRWTLYL